MTLKEKEEYISREEKLRDSIADNFDFNYFIEAGAGAGKTKLVVDRITNQLSKGYCKPEEIAAITFTNKAAQELCDRIRHNLQEIAEKEPSNTNIQESLKDIGRMQISTIHSFCHRILKENCFDAELRLDFELLEDEDASEMKAKFFKKWFNANATSYRDFVKKCPNDIRYRDLESNFKAICDIPDNIVFKYEDISKFDLDKMDATRTSIMEGKKKVVNTYIAAIEEELATSTDPNNPIAGGKFTDSETQKYLESTFLSDDMDKMYEKISSGKCPFKMKGSKELGISINDPTKKLFIQIGESARSKVDADIAKIEKDVAWLNEQEEALTNTLVLDFILKARKEYRKQSFNHYVTNDILLQTVNKLLDNDKVAEKLRKSFKCIYLDESQDTDPVQNELIMKICKDGGEFIPGKLFIVGDVKQSIYRFRDADYRIFNRTKEIFNNNPETCKVESLNINNRSNSDLVDFYNDKVGNLPKGLIPDYAPMIARNDYRTEGVVHGVYKVDKKISKKDKGYNSVVDVIKNLVGKQQICIFNPDEKKLETRPVQYGDILILTRATKNMDDYVNALINAGIPARTSVEYKPCEMKPLKRFVAIYRYLAMPYYKRAKEGILEIAQDNTSCSINENAGKLRDWKKQIGILNGAELIGWLLEHSELYLYDVNPIKGCLIKRYQMAIRQMVDQVLSKGSTNVLSILQALTDYVSEDNTCEREIGYDRKEDAVRFMNIHKAKGLEGNIVIIAGRKADNKNKSTYTEDNDRYQVTWKYQSSYSKEYYSPYVFNTDIALKAEEEQNKETARFEYVAVTRAREVLIFIAPEKDSENILFNNYIDDKIPELYEKFPWKEPEDSYVNDAAKEIIHAKTPMDTISEEKHYRISPSALELPRNIVATEAEKTVEENNGFDVDDFDNYKEEALICENVSETTDLLQKRPSGDIFGTVMHRAFELAVKEIRSDGSNWERCINRAVNENNDDIDLRYKLKAEEEKMNYKVFLSEKVAAFACFISEMIRDADEVYTEYPFSLTVSGEELKDIKSRLTLTKKTAEKLPADGDEYSKDVWINGKADLIIRKGKDTVIWDYKSDKDVTAKDIHDRYDNQMNLYKWVFEKHFGGSVQGKFYSLEIGEA